MTKEKVKEAIDEAIRFISKASLAVKRIEGEKYYYVSKEASACRRSSMDLTRALAELRK